MSDLKITALGGGSGLAVLLRGLKHEVAHRDQLTAVVTVSDDGGSSGRLRRELGVLPPGDIRNCIVALADDEALLSRLFQYRFPSGNGLSGHSFGNLFLTALTGVTGDFYQAILTAEQILSVRGRILPATLQDVRLRGAGRSGRVYDGESAVGRSGERLVRLRLEPPAAPAFPPAVRAIEEADLLVLGPGSLYTSLIPNLLIPGIRAAVERSAAPTVLVMNLMSQPGETDGMSAVEHLAAIEDLAGPGLVDVVLLSEEEPPDPLLARYAESGSARIEVDRGALRDRGVELVECDLLVRDEDPSAATNAPGGEEVGGLERGGLVRHDSAKLARAVVGLAGRVG